MLDTLCTSKNCKYLNQKNIRDVRGDDNELPGYWEYKLLKWKRKYLIISELVDQMQRCFSIVLLIITTSQFIRMITSSFKLMRKIHKQEWTNSMDILYRLFIELSHFIPLIYTPYKISEKVSRIYHIYT